MDNLMETAQQINSSYKVGGNYGYIHALQDVEIQLLNYCTREAQGGNYNEPNRILTVVSNIVKKLRDKKEAEIK